MRRTLAIAATTALTLALGAGTAVAATTTQLPIPIGPECGPSTVSAVLAAVAGRVIPGQKIQYIEVNNGVLILCTVTVPGGTAPAPMPGPITLP